MAPTILFAARPPRWAQYRAPLKRALDEAGLAGSHISPDLPADMVEYIVYAPNSPVQDFSGFPKLKAVLNLWAGVEDVVDNPTLTVPLCRMVDPGLTEGMVEWVTGHVLRHHLGMDAHLAGQDGIWRDHVIPPLARHRHVAILGLGELGSACALALRDLNFRVSGWSRSAKALEGITCRHGQEGLEATLAGAEIVVLLLPATPATVGILNAFTLSVLPAGAIVLNPGRGMLIDDDAMLAALDDGHVAHATLDAFQEEPLPPEHPYWSHPRVTVTPHIASATRPDTASETIAQNIARAERGEKLLHQVDREAGY